MITELPYKAKVTSWAIWGSVRQFELTRGYVLLSKELLEVNPQIFSCVSTEKVRSSLCTVYNEKSVY